LFRNKIYEWANSVCVDRSQLYSVFEEIVFNGILNKNKLVMNYWIPGDLVYTIPDELMDEIKAIFTIDGSLSIMKNLLILQQELKRLSK
jgi:hypothetical protein